MRSWLQELFPLIITRGGNMSHVIKKYVSSGHHQSSVSLVWTKHRSLLTPPRRNSSLLWRVSLVFPLQQKCYSIQVEMGRRARKRPHGPPNMTYWLEGGWIIDMHPLPNMSLSSESFFIQSVGATVMWERLFSVEVSIWQVVIGVRDTINNLLYLLSNKDKAHSLNIEHFISTLSKRW